MKKFLLIPLVVILVTGLVLSGCAEPAPAPAPAPAPSPAPAPAPAKVYELSYALFQPAAAALSVKNTEFAQEIEKRSNGRIKITVQGGGSLLGAPAMYQGVVDGIADMGNGISSYDPGAFPFTSIAELPTSAQSGWAISLANYDFLNKYQPKEWNDAHLLTTVGTAADFLAMMMGKTQIKTVADWKGKSIRTNHADIVTAMGGTVKDVPMADVYDSLSKGVLDGVMGSSEPLKSWKLGEVTKYITLNGAPVQPSIMWYNIMNKKTWESLPADLQKIVTDVSVEYSGKLGLCWDDQAVAGIEFSEAAGDTIYVLPKDEQDRWEAAIFPIIEDRLQTLGSKSGMTQQQVTEAWDYLKSRVDYWNGKQAANGITPVMQRMQAATK